MKYFIFALLLGSAANAQSNCAPYEIVRDRLVSPPYEETLQSIGLTNSSVRIEIWANLEEGNWSALTVFPTGLACMAALGTDYLVVEQEPLGEDL